MLPFNLADGHRVDVHDIVRAGLWAPIKALARVEACFRWVKSDHRAQKRVSDMGVNRVLVAINMNLRNHW